MDCPNCRAPMVSFEVPAEFQSSVPEESDAAAVCPECLTLAASEEATPDPRFDRISSAFPTDGPAAVALTIAIGLLDSLALHRNELEELLEVVESAGVDPLLVLDRLHTQGGVQPHFDLDRRRHQLEQLLE